MPVGGLRGRDLHRPGRQQQIAILAPDIKARKIRDFEAQQVPVDAYGVGSAFFQGTYDFTADVVMVEGRPCAKAGRRYRPNPRLEPVT